MQVSNRRCGAATERVKRGERKKGRREGTAQVKGGIRKRGESREERREGKCGGIFYAEDSYIILMLSYVILISIPPAIEI